MIESDLSSRFQLKPQSIMLRVPVLITLPYHNMTPYRYTTGPSCNIQYCTKVLDFEKKVAHALPSLICSATSFAFSHTWPKMKFLPQNPGDARESPSVHTAVARPPEQWPKHCGRNITRPNCPMSAMTTSNLNDHARRARMKSCLLPPIGVERLCTPVEGHWFPAKW
jgi:hypothetical protein